MIYDEVSDLVYEIFGLIRSQARGALEALRYQPDDEASIAAWAREYRLDEFPALVAHAAYLRGEWTHYPKWAEQLTVGALMCGVTLRAHSPEYEAWSKRVRLPDPARETREEWLKRAAKLYQEASAFSMRRPERWHARKMHAAWFVQNRVLNLPVSSIDSSSSGTDRAVELGIARVERMLRAYGDFDAVPIFSRSVPSHEK